MNHHQYQIESCRVGELPILNAACKEDPAHLGQLFNATNLDITNFCMQTKTNLNNIPNFIQGDALDLPFENESYNTVVLGEFIEHCIPAAAVKAFEEAWRVLTPQGLLIVTFPLDHRPPHAQHAKDQLVVTVAGETGTDITVWHQTVWTDEMLESLFVATGPWIVEEKKELDYGFIRNVPNGWGFRLRKDA